MGLNKDNSSEKEEEYVSGFTRIKIHIRPNGFSL